MSNRRRTTLRDLFLLVLLAVFPLLPFQAINFLHSDRQWLVDRGIPALELGVILVLSVFLLTIAFLFALFGRLSGSRRGTVELWLRGVLAGLAGIAVAGAIALFAFVLV